MKKHRAREVGGYWTLPVKLEGTAYTVYLCRHCAKGWRLRDPVEAWRIKVLLVHVSSHRADAAIGEMMREVPAHAKKEVV